MTRSKKLKLLRLALSGGIILSSFFVCLTSTYAWMAANSVAEGKGMSVKIDPGTDIRVSDYDIYYFDQINNVGKKANDGNLSLNKYDAFIPSKNDDNRKIARFTLDFPRGLPVNKLATLVINVNLNSGDNNEGKFVYTEGSEKFVYNNISNIIQFKFHSNVLDAGDQISGETDNDIYHSAKNVFKTASTKTFFNAETPALVESSKNNTIVGEYANLPMSSDTTIDTFELFIEFDYNQPLINLYNQNSAIPMSQDLATLKGQDINFAGDIKDIAFSLKDK